MIEVQTATKEVTVFIDGARVIREGKVKLQKGEQDLLFKGICRNMREDSVRLAGLSNAELVNLTIERETQSTSDVKRLKELRDRLRELEREKQIIKGRVDRTQKALAQLVRLTQIVAAETAHRLAREDEKTSASEKNKEIYEMIAERKEAIRADQRKLEKIEVDINNIEENIDSIGGSDYEVHYNVRVRLNVMETMESALQMIYQVTGASWEPQYDIDLRTDGTRVKRLALISNETEEDWTKVKLMVSTASSRPVEVIEPTPYYVGVWRPRPAPSRVRRGIKAKKAAPPPPAAPAAMDMEIAGYEEVEPVMDEVYAEVTQSIGGILTYDVPGETTVLTGGDPKPVTLTEETFESRRLYYWNAYAMPGPVVLEEITNGDSTLLEGGAKIYADGDFVGESTIEMAAPREKFKIGTREAFDVRTEKKLLHKDTEKAGIRGKNRREYKYALIIKNFAKSEIDFEVTDRIPHSSSERIKVELGEVSVEPESFEVGVLKWKVKIPAQEELRIEYDYVVEWERDVSISPPLP